MLVNIHPHLQFNFSFLYSLYFLHPSRRELPGSLFSFIYSSKRWKAATGSRARATYTSTSSPIVYLGVAKQPFTTKAYVTQILEPFAMKPLTEPLHTEETHLYLLSLHHRSLISVLPVTISSSNNQTENILFPYYS